MEQLSQRQRRRDLIKSLLQLKDANKKDGTTQIDNATLEAQIKQFDCQQIQNYTETELQKNIFCRYNLHKKAQFLCCSEYCENHAIMCGVQTCKCALDHQNCSFISIESFIQQIARKIQKSIPKQIELYFQVKSVIYEHMANRISQERQALMDWQQDNHSDSDLFLYGFKRCKVMICHAPKVAYKQKINYNHQKCCVPLQIRKKNIKEHKKENIKAICKKIHKKYSSMIQYFDQKVDQLYYHKKYANLNSAEFMFIDFLKNKNNFIEESVRKQFDSDGGLEEIKIVAGHLIYLARKCTKKQLQNLDLQNFCIDKLRKIWKGYSEKKFRLFIEGKAINELFCQMRKSSPLKAHSVEDLQSQIDAIVQSISQGQEHLFSKSVLTKKLVLKNLKEEQIFTKLKEYKRKEVNKVYSSNNSQKPIKFRYDKFDQVCISNDRFCTALNDIETIKELGNLRNVTKLEIKWCSNMRAQVSIEILNTMPHLKQLALLYHFQKFSQNFMKKLCQFKQLTFFYIDYYSQPQYYRSFNEDCWFNGLSKLKKDNLPLMKELVELSKLPKLQNIEISQLNDANSAQVIKNMKSLRHLTLGYSQKMHDKVDAGLMKQLCEQRALITLSLTELKLKSRLVERIIKNNPHLKTIIIRNAYPNENINDETIECMANLIQLQNLCITANTEITGKHLSKLNKLIILEISNCQNFSKKEIKQALKNMKKLQYLNIKSNKWFDDEVIASVQSCKQLTYLNICFTSVSWQGLKHLKELTRLNILICCWTKINGKSLIELTKHVTTITRLSIFNLYENEILQISANCQSLTHLDIKDINITVETLLKIKQLKVVNINFDENSKKKLREAGIQNYYY